MTTKGILAVFLAGTCALSQGLACSWDYPIWPKSKKSDTPLFRFVVNQEMSGYIDSQGHVAIPPQFAGRTNGGDDFIEGVAGVFTKGEGYFFIDAAGNKIPKGAGGQFSEGVAPKRIGEKVGYINKSGRFVIPAQFDYGGEFSEGLAVVKVGALYGYVDHSGNLAIALQFARANSFHDGVAVVIENGPCTWVDYGPCAAFTRQPFRPMAASRRRPDHHTGASTPSLTGMASLSLLRSIPT